MTIKKVNCGSIRSLYDILHRWTKIVDKYIRYFEYQDNPWWYNERATLSTLAAASWLCDGISLEEYSTEKGKHDDPWKGRCDLFIGVKKEFFACEAKQAWCPIGRQAKNGIKNISNSLRIACNDARKLDKQEGRRLGICFAVPYLPRKDEEHIEKQINQWLKGIEKNIECSSYAWVFPRKVRSLVSPEAYFHPGIAVIIKEVFRKA